MAEKEVFSELGVEDAAQLERLRDAVRVLTQQGEASPTALDMQSLQRLIDGGSVRSEDERGLWAIGVCFGDLLVEMAGELRWGVVEDQWGRGFALRWSGSTLNIHAPAMILRRVEEGEHPDLAQLAAEVVGRARELVEGAPK